MILLTTEVIRGNLNCFFCMSVSVAVCVYVCALVRSLEDRQV